MSPRARATRWATSKLFASRLVMAGVSLLTVKELGGWRTLSIVQAVARLAGGGNDSQLGVNLDFTKKAEATAAANVS